MTRLFFFARTKPQMHERCLGGHDGDVARVRGGRPAAQPGVVEGEDRHQGEGGQGRRGEAITARRDLDLNLWNCSPSH